ncbi:MAG: hypothetical protein K9K67_13115 [Bacteriovoracaceae bacterium]|nr:hypothetical protein [Bacteriovoracaceae bacterium]
MKLKNLFILSLMVGLTNPAYSNIIPHSFKKLSVGGTEMILFQLFVEEKSQTVISGNEMLGVSQSGNQVSLYIDYDLVLPELRDIMKKDSYLRDKRILTELLRKNFTINKNGQSILIKLKD